MADAVLKAVSQTPLSAKAPIAIDGLGIAERPLVGKITLRGDAGDPTFADAAAKALGTALPTTPMTSAVSGETTVFWKAFDEWLIWTEDDAREQTLTALRDALSGVHKAMVDVSDYYTIIRVDGRLSRELLAKGCALDLHPDAFAEGNATGTGFHQAQIFITRTDKDAFDLMIRWSVAEYLYDYLADGAREWGG
jgi:sarcosine oxidase subunit gamma